MTLNLNFDDYLPVNSADGLHLIPKNDVDTHDEEGIDCRCKPIKLKVETHSGNSFTVGILHQSFDMREYKDILPNISLHEAIEFRKKYKENMNTFVQKGVITQGKANMKGFEFNSFFEEVFKVN